MSGTSASTATPTSSRSTYAACATRWAGTSSPPSAAPATGSAADMRSVRLRTTTAAVVVVGAGLLVGAAGLLVSLRSAMLADVRGSLAVQATEAVKTANSGGDPALAVAGNDDVVLQLVDADGQVLTAS